MRTHVLAALAALVLAAPARAADPPRVENPSFEVPTDGPSRWDVLEGATSGDSGVKSEVAMDKSVAREGKQSLRLSGSGGVTSWQYVAQKVAVPAGVRVTLRVAARSAGVRREGRQFVNAHAVLEFVDAANARIALDKSPTLFGERDWTELRVSALAPANTAAVRIGLFLSMSGTVWFDDVRLTVEPASLADEAGRATAAAAVEDHLRATYPFFGLDAKPRADVLFASWRAKLTAAKDEDAFVQALRDGLAPLDDLHVWLKRGSKLLSTAQVKAVRGNLFPATRRAALTDVLDDKAPVLCGRIGQGADAVGYVEIATWQMNEGAVARVEAALDALADCRGIVLDVRANTGGDERVAQRIATRFCEKDVVYARSRFRDPLAPADDALLPPADRVLPGRKGARADLRPVAVLQGRVCMSSCEGFLLMARALPTVTTFGDRSRGATANPQVFAITPDLQLNASTWRAYTLDDQLVELAGVEPEVPVAQAKDSDAVLAAAVAHIRR